MMSNYKPIGDYIKPLKNKNSDLKASELFGINIDKYFMPSVANVVGTDLTRYKVVEKRQFACNRMHVGRDYRIPIALSDREEPFIVSPAYDVFEIIDINILDPDYLMMWFSRREFDRNAWFFTDADVRGGLAWDAFCNMKLPVPTIEKQRAIVAEYNTVKNRIALNNQLIQKLEETAQAIYKQWFVDFEFPDENGNPPALSGAEGYKSSGGKMVWNEELEKEIPEGWEYEEIMNHCQVTSSKRIFESEYQTLGVPFYRAGEIKQKKEGKIITDALFISEKRFEEVKAKFGSPQYGDILLTAVGSLLGVSYLVDESNFYFKDGNVVWFKAFEKVGVNLLVYGFLQSLDFIDFLDEIKIGSGQSAITIKSINEKKLLFPDKNLLKEYKSIMESVYTGISIKKKQNIKLINFSNLLLSKIATIEN